MINARIYFSCLTAMFCIIQVNWEESFRKRPKLSVTLLAKIFEYLPIESFQWIYKSKFVYRLPYYPFRKIIQAAYLANLTNLSEFIARKERGQARIILSDTEVQSFQRFDDEKFAEEQ